MTDESYYAAGAGSGKDLRVVPPGFQTMLGAGHAAALSHKE